MVIALNDALDAYVRCALWTEHCNGGEQHDGCRGQDCDTALDSLGYTIDDLDALALEEMQRELDDFIGSCLAEDPNVFDGINAEQIGHDFWLTRNHHGVGFWDRGLGDRGDWLTKRCHPYGTSSLYVYDSVVYVSS